jgi:outer membrane protein TolC
MRRALVILLFAALPVLAEPVTITVDEAIAKAIDVHPELRAVTHRRQAAAADATAASTRFLPTVSANSNLTHNGELATTTFGGRSVAIGAEDVFDLTGRVDQTVFTAGRVQSEVRQADLGHELARARQNAMRNSVTTRAREACFELFRRRALHAASVNALAAAQTHRKDAEARVRAGVAAGVEVIRAEVRVQEAALDESSKRNARDLAMSRLATILGLSTAAEIRLAGDLPTGAIQKDLSDAEETALQFRPDLQAQRTIARSEELGVRIANAGYWPSLGAFGSWTWQDDETRRGDDSWKIGLSGNWEIFNWGRTTQNVRAASSRTEAARADIRTLEDQIRIEVRDAQLAIQSALEALKLADARIRAASEDLRISRLRFQEGVGTGTEVIDAESDLAGAEAALINARADHALAQNRFWIATGGDLSVMAR